MFFTLHKVKELIVWSGEHSVTIEVEGTGLAASVVRSITAPFNFKKRIKVHMSTKGNYTNLYWHVIYITILRLFRNLICKNIFHVHQVYI